MSDFGFLQGFLTSSVCWLFGLLLWIVIFKLKKKRPKLDPHNLSLLEQARDDNSRKRLSSSSTIHSSASKKRKLPKDMIPICDESDTESNDPLNSNISVRSNASPICSSSDFEETQTNIQNDLIDIEQMSYSELLELVRTQADKIAELKELVEGCESNIIINEHINDFKLSRMMDVNLAHQEFNESLPTSASVHERKLANRNFIQLMPECKSIYFYLLTKLDKTKKSIGIGHVLYGVNEIVLIQILLSLAAQMKGIFAKDCIGVKTLKRRPYVNFLDCDGKSKAMTSGRMICSIVYGFDAMNGRHGSHLCGNSRCLNPAHLYPEKPSQNLERDECHASGFYDEQSCDHFPTCLQSLKHNTDIAFGAQRFNHEKISLTSDNFVLNLHGGLNIQMEDHEYSKNKSGNRYFCVKGHTLGCDAYLILSGSDEHKTAVLRRGHLENCPTLSEQEEDWIENSFPLTNDMLLYKNERLAHIFIEPHKHTFNRGLWICTSTDCNASLKVIGDRARLMNGHKCDEKLKQQKFDALTEMKSNSKPYTVDYKKDKEGHIQYDKSRNPIIHFYHFDGHKFMANKGCTRNQPKTARQIAENKGANKCPARIVIDEEKQTAFLKNEHRHTN